VSFKDALRSKGYKNVYYPALGEAFEINPKGDVLE
jgi:hypothetical protein